MGNTRRQPKKQFKDSGATLLLSILEGPSAGELIELSKFPAVVGRKSNTEVHLNDLCVSEKHAELYWQDDHWHLKELGSSNGTSVNGITLGDKDEPKQLQSGDRIRFGTESVAVVEIPEQMTMEQFITCCQHRMHCYHEMEAKKQVAVLTSSG